MYHSKQVLKQTAGEFGEGVWTVVLILGAETLWCISLALHLKWGKEIEVCVEISALNWKHAEL